jgi:hypothetical protein
MTVGAAFAVLALLLLPGCFGSGEKSDKGPKASPYPSPESLKEAVEVFVKKKALPNKGFFEFYDKERKGVVSAKLVKIYTDKVVPAGPDTYKVGADFEDKDGKPYVIDFTVKGPKEGPFEIPEILVREALEKAPAEEPKEPEKKGEPAEPEKKGEPAEPEKKGEPAEPEKKGESTD